MPGRANDLIVIPDSFWQRAETTAALRHRDIGRIFWPAPAVRRRQPDADRHGVRHEPGQGQRHRPWRFGPTNATLHRVNIAVTLGDAGTAIEVARHIGLAAISVTERRAALLIDTARAFLQLGKHEKAYLALRAAEGTAHEEVAGRPLVHRLLRELVSTAPPTVRRDAEHFARQMGAQQ